MWLTLTVISTNAPASHKCIETQNSTQIHHHPPRSHSSRFLASLSRKSCARAKRVGHVWLGRASVSEKIKLERRDRSSDIASAYKQHCHALLHHRSYTLSDATRSGKSRSASFSTGQSVERRFQRSIMRNSSITSCGNVLTQARSSFLGKHIAMQEVRVSSGKILQSELVAQLTPKAYGTTDSSLRSSPIRSGGSSNNIRAIIYARAHSISAIKVFVYPLENPHT